ncbi:MAG: hypothetical protein DRP64_04915 [Verrucomicrobia bacterium]|nr:MAG: hypothetical protein DRP64_04915 [Verrucomicrobiota bacterium]
MLDLKGPGTVYRIWSTGFVPATDTVKVYFDGESTPRINMLLKDLFLGSNAPFLSPLVGDDDVSSGGFYCYLPLPFNESIKMVTSASATGLFFYNIGYDRYSPDTSVTTWTGAENSTAPRDLWNNAGVDPKSNAGNITVANTFSLAAGATQTLLDVSGPRSISSIQLKIPGISRDSEPPPATITDDGRAFTGYSQFRMALNSANTGATLVRRLDYGIADQTARVYVDGALVGIWENAGVDGGNRWRNEGFPIPSGFTAGKNSITIKIEFISSAIDWNEFTYWAYSTLGGTDPLTDTLDVGNPSSESSHNYEINGQTWSGTGSFTYPLPFSETSLATMDILNNLWLKISFDDETNPSVHAPLGSFFGMGQFGANNVQALPVGIDANDNLYCYFPMPFSRRAVVQLVSQHPSAAIDVDFEIRHKPFTEPFASVGYFTTHFQPQIPSTNGTDLILLDVEGCGHFLGVVQSMTGPISRWHLEGDERIYVDDSNTPVVYGTGKEDFYNAGWYFNRGLFTLPTHGNSAHFSDVEADTDYTTAYRLFIADAIPFRKHIRVGIEHGGGNEIPETCTTLAYYYYKPNNMVVLTDLLNVGNTTSESAHSYTIGNQTWSSVATFQYEGDHDDVDISDVGRAHQGYSQFTMALQPTNAGAILRRRLDYHIADQQATVSVDGVLVGTWYQAGSNPFHGWREDDFMIPAAYTAGKNTITVKVQFVSSAVDWNEFHYALYTVLPATPPTANAQAVSSYANYELTVTLYGSDPGGYPLTFIITALPATGTLYQYSNGARGEAITALNTPVSDPFHRIIYVPDVNGTGAPYSSFSFIVDNGRDRSAPEQVTLTVEVPTLPQFTGATWQGGAGQSPFQLDYTGVSNAIYSMWGTTNLVQSPWLRLGATTEESTGQYRFVDPAATNRPTQFYRLSAP